MLHVVVEDCSPFSLWSDVSFYLPDMSILRSALSSNNDDITAIVGSFSLAWGAKELDSLAARPPTTAQQSRPLIFSIKSVCRCKDNAQHYTYCTLSIGW